MPLHLHRPDFLTCVLALACPEGNPGPWTTQRREAWGSQPCILVRADLVGGRHLTGLSTGPNSSGGKTRLGRIIKADDGDLRSLLVMGAWAVPAAAKRKTDPFSRWTVALAERRGDRKAGWPLRRRTRTAWAVLRKGEAFVPPA